MDQLTADQFAAADGTADWRVLGWQAYTVYRTGDFATGLRLVNAIGELAEAADHHPDVKLGYPQVELRLATHSTSSLTEKDVDLAGKIAAAARDLGVPADPEAATEW